MMPKNKEPHCRMVSFFFHEYVVDQSIYCDGTGEVSLSDKLTVCFFFR